MVAQAENDLVKYLNIFLKNIYTKLFLIYLQTICQLGASVIWEDILSTHPKDMLALQMLFFTHLTTGRRRGLRDCVTRVAKHHRPGESRSGKIFLILSIFCRTLREFHLFQPLFLP